MIKMKEKSACASSKETGLKLIETAKDRIVRVIGTGREVKVIGIGREVKVIGIGREVKVAGTGHEAIVSMLNALIMKTGCGT